MVGSVIALQKGIGWKHVQLDNVTKLQKSWEWEGKEYRVEAYFGTMRCGGFPPTLVMNVYEQGAGTKQVVDDNCDVWTTMFTTTTKDEGNEYFKYLLKHGFAVCR